MSSREIAELTGKELPHVHRDIRAMLDELKKDDPDLDHPLEDKDARGYTTCFYLNRELTETLLTGYSAIARRKVIRRWHQLEGAATSQPKLAAPKGQLLDTQLSIGKLFEVPVHLAQVEAVKVVRLQLGTDLSPWLRLAPAQDNLRTEDVFLEPTDIGRMFGVTGKYVNAGLLNLGLQVKQGTGYEPTDLGTGHAHKHQWTKGAKSGVNLKWRVSFVKTQLGLQEAA